MAGRKKPSSTLIRLWTVDVMPDGLHLLLKARINGRVARLVLDTGASRTVLDKNRVKKFLRDGPYREHDAVSTGLGTNTMQSYVAEIRKLELGVLKVKGYTAVLLDLAHVNHTLREAGMKEIDGVLGGDLLAAHKAVIDYGRKTMKLYF